MWSLKERIFTLATYNFCILNLILILKMTHETNPDPIQRPSFYDVGSAHNRARLLTIDTRFVFLLIIYEWSHEYERISKDEWGVKFVFSLKYQQLVITPKNEF